MTTELPVEGSRPPHSTPVQGEQGIAAPRKARPTRQPPLGPLDGVFGRLVERIQHRHDLADAARAAETRFRALFEGVGEALVVMDQDGRYLDANCAMERLVGYSRAELARRGVGDLTAGDPARSRAQFEQLKREGRWRGELELRRADGSTVPVEGQATTVELLSGTVYLMSWRDISERRALERLQQEFLAMVSHELRNPLAAIKGYAELMQRRQTFSEQAVRAIVGQTNHLDRLVGDLLEVSRLEAGRLNLHREPTNLVTLVHEVSEHAGTLSTAHTIRVAAPDRPLIGAWDRDRLGQVLRNLLSNAVKYAPDGGEVLVQVEDLGQAAEVTVRDHGLGIPPELMPRLFERFYRGAAQHGTRGVGLGLYIARSIVEAHGGQVRAESDGEGCGSTFTVTLPYQRDV